MGSLARVGLALCVLASLPMRPQEPRLAPRGEMRPLLPDLLARYAADRASLLHVHPPASHLVV